MSKFLENDDLTGAINDHEIRITKNTIDILSLQGNSGGGREGGGDFMADGSVPMSGDLNLSSNKIINVGGLKIDPENLKTSDGKPFTSWLSGTEFILYYDSSNGDTNPNSTYMKKIESGLSWDNAISIIVSINDINNYTQKRLLNEYIKAGDLITVSTIVNYFDITYKILSIEEQGEGLFFKIGMKRYTDSSQSLYISLENGDPVKLSFTKNQFVDLTEPQTIHGAKIFTYLKSSQVPTVSNDVVNFGYFNANNGDMKSNGSIPMSGDLNMGDMRFKGLHKIVNLADPVSENDGVNKSYCDSNSGFKVLVSMYEQIGFGADLILNESGPLFSSGLTEILLFNQIGIQYNILGESVSFENFISGWYEINVDVPLIHEENAEVREYRINTLINEQSQFSYSSFGRFNGTAGSNNTIIPFAHMVQFNEIHYLKSTDKLRFSILDLGLNGVGGFGVGCSEIPSRIKFKLLNDEPIGSV